MKRYIKLLLVGALTLALVVSVVGCGNSTPGGQSEKPKLVVGTNATFPPFESQENNELVGFDMELIRAIGEAEGYDVQVKHMDFKSLVPAVKTGKIDAAIAGMSITEERLESVAFTDAYFNAGLVVAVRDDNQDIKGPNDLKGKKLAAQTGTIGAGYCDKVAKKDSSTQVRTYDDVAQAFMELEKGGVDAVVNDHPVTLNYILTTEKARVKTVGDVFSANDKYGIAVAKDNQKLLQDLNDGLKKVKADGTYDQIYAKWIDQ
jgi:glutamine transport system substrate-binding protein